MERKLDLFVGYFVAPLKAFKKGDNIGISSSLKNHNRALGWR